MDVRQLRIGNWISIDNENPQQWTLESFKTLAEHPMTAGNITPIELTVDWLLKFGFVVEKQSGFMPDFYSIKGGYWITIALYKSLSGDAFYFEDLRDLMMDNNRCEYVHQLQNLYFVLRKKELVIEIEKRKEVA